MKSQFPACWNASEPPATRLGAISGELTLQGIEDLSLQGKHVIIIDDIFDTGKTMTTIKEKLLLQQPASLKTLVLLFKKKQAPARSHAIVQTTFFSPLKDQICHRLWPRLSRALQGPPRSFHKMKGVILAGGRGTRLYPVTLGTCKQLLPVFDKPLIYYPLAVLMQAGIREVLIVTTPEDLHRFQALFKDGSQFGISISYAVQSEPKGIAEVFVIGADFIGKDSVCLILGDNIFYGHNIAEVVRPCTDLKEGGIVFGYEVNDPERYGVIGFCQ